MEGDNGHWPKRIILMTDAFSSEDCEVFARALVQAWRHLLETRQSGDEALDMAALSQAILKAGDLGERSEPVLVAYALAHWQENKLDMRRRMDCKGA
jgi:hypothetical protein